MCGRFTQISAVQKLSKKLKIPVLRIPRLKSHYNIAPSQSAAVLIHEAGQPPEIRLMQWGLIPSWAKDPTVGNRLINARRETLAEKPSFRDSLKSRRCLIPSDGFYEWKQEGRRKTPYCIRFKSEEPLVFAGLWSQWRNPEGSQLRTFTIITGEPNELVRSIHGRMPVILGDEVQNKWLNPPCPDTGFLLSLLDVYPAEDMEAYAVSTKVNDPKNDSPDCAERWPGIFN